MSHLPPTKAHVHLSPTVIFSFVQKGSQHLRRSPPSSPGRRTGGHGCPPLKPHPKGRCLLTPRSPSPSPSCSPRLSPRTDSCLPSMRSTAKPSWDGAKPHSAALSLPEGATGLTQTRSGATAPSRCSCMSWTGKDTGWFLFVMGGFILNSWTQVLAAEDLPRG